MSVFSIECDGVGPLVFYGMTTKGRHDCVVQSNCAGLPPNYLIFLDSRGVSRAFHGSLAERLAHHVAEQGKRYLLICRPTDLTTWASLVNFLEMNDVVCDYLITNMGFVDFTPKKRQNLEDIMLQVERMAGPDVAISHFIETIDSIQDGKIPLFATHYTNVYQERIKNRLVRQPSLVINTPRVRSDIKIERQRPESFFGQILKTIDFNQSLDQAHVVDLPEFDCAMTYDAVHYTDQGNGLIFDRVLRAL